MLGGCGDWRVLGEREGRTEMDWDVGDVKRYVMSVGR